MDRKNYQTAGRRRLVSFLAAHPDCQFTVEELCLSVNGDANVGKSSLYRQLSALCDEETEHLDCGDSVVFARHLMAEHGFAIDCGQSVLYGICRKCLKKTEGKRLG